MSIHSLYKGWAKDPRMVYLEVLIKYLQQALTCKYMLFLLKSDMFLILYIHKFILEMFCTSKPESILQERTFEGKKKKKKFCLCLFNYVTHNQWACTQIVSSELTTVNCQLTQGDQVSQLCRGQSRAYSYKISSCTST